jgi:hypothetical protein
MPIVNGIKTTKKQAYFHYNLLIVNILVYIAGVIRILSASSILKLNW